jgi:hypothetical protein
MPTPSVNTNPGANQYASPGERIIEFHNNNRTAHKGGLISLANRDDGTLTVHVYKHDQGVTVTSAPPEHYVEPVSERPSIAVWGHTIQAAAHRQVASLVSDLTEGEVAHYATENRRLVRFMIAGNGPTAYACFLMEDDGEIRNAYVEYSEGDGHAYAPIPWDKQAPLYAALRAYGSGR